MNENKTKRTILIYCGKKLYSYAYKKGNVYKVLFVDAEGAIREFYTNGYNSVPLILEHCKTGNVVDVIWKNGIEPDKPIVVDVKTTNA